MFIFRPWGFLSPLGNVLHFISYEYITLINIFLIGPGCANTNYKFLILWFCILLYTIAKHLVANQLPHLPLPKSEFMIKKMYFIF